MSASHDRGACWSPADTLAHLDQSRLWPGAPAVLDDSLPAAYHHALDVADLRRQRGEQPRGFKIGFTNEDMWTRFAVHAPIWGLVWDSTLSHDPQGGQPLSLDDLSQPRIEPEIVFGLRATPASDSAQDLFDAIDWLAPGFEVVQAHLADWRFTAAEGIMDGGLHGRLRVGRRESVRPRWQDAADLHGFLAGLRVTLSRDGEAVDQGVGAKVLGSPLAALGHLVRELAAHPRAPALAAGDVVTTGTLTNAWAIGPNQTWHADFGPDMPALSVRLV